MKVSEIVWEELGVHFACSQQIYDKEGEWARVYKTIRPTGNLYWINGAQKQTNHLDILELACFLTLYTPKGNDDDKAVQHPEQCEGT